MICGERDNSPTGRGARVASCTRTQLQHTALRLTVRGWETLPLPAPDGTGALVVALDLRTHEAVAEHSDGRSERVALTPNRPVREVTCDVLAAVRRLVGPVEINPRPQETSWTTPLDEDDEHDMLSWTDGRLGMSDAEYAEVHERAGELDPAAAKAYAATHPVLCAHADDDGQGAHWLAPGENCSRHAAASGMEARQ